MDAIEKARILACEMGTSMPPELNELCDLDLPVTALASTSGDTRRVWDTGATSGMTKPGTTNGRIETGRTARVFTGAGVVKTDQWVVEDLSWGTVRHVALKDTTNTISAGQLNSEIGVETSWLAPAMPSESSPCGPCVIHRNAGGHVLWTGAHQFQLAKIAGRTPELEDNQ